GEAVIAASLMPAYGSFQGPDMGGGTTTAPDSIEATQPRTIARL
ncbi:MAG: hypothetical protein K0S14_3321, partial [Thermomicrobiales bacterium]|nr:hypothetical protein [Thermomicrobiales bacterium]